MNTLKTEIKIILLITTATTMLLAQGPNANNNPLAESQIQSVNNDDTIVQMNIKNKGSNPVALVQQGSAPGSLNNAEKPCTDCDKVKQAIKASHASSGSSHKKKKFSVRGWSKTIEGKLYMKYKKTFARKHKAKTSYAICFNWH